MEEVKQYLPHFITLEPRKLNLFLKYISSMKKTITFLHDKLLTFDPHCTEIISQAKEKELGVEISGHIWDVSVTHIHALSIDDIV